MWCVVNPDGTFAGVPCESWEEARELANAREGRKIFEMKPVNKSFPEWDEILGWFSYEVKA